MNTDIRDDELRALFDRATSRIDPDPERRLGDVRRSGNIRRALRWTAIGSVLTLFLGALGWTAVELRGRDPGPVSLGGSDWAEYHQPDQNWTVQYPPQWHLQPFAVTCGPGGAEGVLAANVVHDFNQVRGSNFCTLSWDMRGLPPTLVVIQIGASGGGLCEPNENPDTPLPLSLDSAKRVWDGEEYLGIPQPRLYLPVIVQGNDYRVDAWIGQGASASDREIARRIVASIEFGHQTKPCQ